MPDVEKRARADFVIDTSQGLDPVRRQVAQILETMRDPQRRPKRDRGAA
jgi:dephospho-CoA kinase